LLTAAELEKARPDELPIKADDELNPAALPIPPPESRCDPYLLDEEVVELG